MFIILQILMSVTMLWITVTLMHYATMLLVALGALASRGWEEMG